MMSRALFVLMALAASMPAVAQTRVVTLKAADEVVAAILSPRGDRIAAAVGKDRVAVWSLPDGKLLQELKFPQRTISALFAPSDQIIVALADGAIEVRAIATGAAVRRIEAGVRQSVLAVSADGRLLASSDREQIRLWDSSGKLLRTFSHEFGSMSTLAFSPDGTLLASAGLDANVHVWDVSTGQQKASVRDQLVSTFAMSFTADSRHLVIGGAIEIVDVQTASIARRFRAEKYAVSSISLSPDGRSVGAAYFDVDGMARPAPLVVWEFASGRVVRRVTPPGAAAMVAGFSTEGRLLYATAKGHELDVWVLPGSGAPSAGSRSTAGSSADRQTERRSTSGRTSQNTWTRRPCQGSSSTASTPRPCSSTPTISSSAFERSSRLRPSSRPGSSTAPRQRTCWTSPTAEALAEIRGELAAAQSLCVSGRDQGARRN